MADGFNFLKDILFTPASVRAQNNQADILRQQAAMTGQQQAPVMQEINRLRQANPNMPANQMVNELMKSPAFMDAFTADPDTFKTAMEAIKASQAPAAPDPYTLGQGDVRFGGDNKPVAFGAGVGADGRAVPTQTDKIKNFEYFTQGLPPEEQASLRAAQLSDDPSSKDATIARLQRLGWPEDQAVKFAEGVIKQVTQTDKMTGETKVLWLDQSDPTNPQVFELPQQAMPQGGMGGGAAPQARGPAPAGAGAMTGGRSRSDNETYATGVAKKTAALLGVDPTDVLATFGYETGGSYDPWQGGPTTKWGKHRGLIQWGETQRRQYGIRPNMTEDEQANATARYLRDRGVKPGASMLQIYAAINGGNVNAVNASDEAAGGAPGTVADKVASRNMQQHRARAAALLGGTASPGAAGLNQAEDINQGRPSGRRLAEAFLTAGPVGGISGTMERLGQIVKPDLNTAEGTRASEDTTLRAQMANNFRAMAADLGRGNNVSKYEAEQFNDTIANIEGATSAQAALANVRQGVASAEDGRRRAQAILDDSSQSLEEKKAANQRLNIFNDRLANMPSLEDIDAVLAQVRSGGPGPSTIGGTIDQAQRTIDQLIPTAQGLAGQVEGAAQSLIPETGLDPNSISKMSLDQIKQFAGDAANMTPEQRAAFRARLQALKAAGPGAK